MKKAIVFSVAGLVGGITCAIVGASQPSVLAVGIGPLFFAGLLVAMILTGSWRRVRPGVWRYVAAALTSTVAGVLALFLFSVVAGYAPKIPGVRTSGDIVEFRLDVWLGLVVAAAVASVAVELVATLFTGRWSNHVLARLIVAGLATVLVTFVVNLPFHRYWSFMGALLAVGNALFCGLVGKQIWKNGEATERSLFSASP